MNGESCRSGKNCWRCQVERMLAMSATRCAFLPGEAVYGLSMQKGAQGTCLPLAEAAHARIAFTIELRSQGPFP